MNKVAFVWHMNLNASLLPRPKVITYATKWIPAMLATAKVPQNISSMGEDWLVLQRIAPDLITQIKEDDQIGILNGTFSHGLFAGFRDLQGVQATYPGMNMPAIRSAFFKVRQAQLSLGDYIHRKIFGNKLAGVGMIPEFDLTSLEIDQIKQYWELSILKQTVNRFQDSDRTPIDLSPGLAEVLNVDSSATLPCLITNDTYNQAFHQFYLGKIKPTDLVRSITEYSGSQPQVIVMDLDGLFLNRTSDDPETDPGFEAWQEFQKALAQSSLDIMTISTLLEETQAGKFTAQGEYFAGPRDYSKWQVPYYDEQVIAQALALITADDPYQKLLVLSNMTSDRYSAITKDPKTEISEFGTAKKQIRFNQVGFIHTDFYVREQALINRTTIAKTIEQIDQILNGTFSTEQKYFLLALDASIKELASAQYSILPG